MNRDDISLIVALLAFAVSGWSVLVSWRGLRRSTYRTATDLALEADRLFIEYPELRPYFYDRRDVPDLRPERDRILAMAEFYLDILEAIWDHRNEFTRDDHVAWREWVHDLFETSPAVQAVYTKDPDWYPTVGGLLAWEACTDTGHSFAWGQPGPNGRGPGFRLRRRIRDWRVVGRLARRG